MRFSSLASRFLKSKNRLYQTYDKLVSEGNPILDLISGNVNDHGIVFPKLLLNEILEEAREQATIYKPNPLGQLSARNAIAEHNSTNITPDCILLTPGTSISYWYCFTLLCESGDEILCPTPSYPLFDYIADISKVTIKNYKLIEHQQWMIDLEHLEDQITPKTRGIVTISPHNPTGVAIDSQQANALATIAKRYALPIITDEVFREFLFEGENVSLNDRGIPLLITLNGLAKMFALPSLKIGWMAIEGQSDLVHKAIATLELISDAFLPVNEVAQFTVPLVFKKGQEFLKEYRQHIWNRRNTALTALEGFDLVKPQGGFYLVLPYNREIKEEDLAIELLQEEGLLTHPGYYYEIEGRHIVLSYVHNPSILIDSIQRMKSHL